MKRLFLLGAAAALSWLAARPSARAMEGMEESQTFHALRADIDTARTNRDWLANWDALGWYGGDLEKIFLRAKGETLGRRVESAEFWGLYSRNIAEFWDVQGGMRQDISPRGTSYFVAGFQGLHTYFFETEAHAFVSDKGDLGARLEQTVDLPITQRLIVEPHLEANLFAQDARELRVAAGITNIEAGLQLRYEIVRKFAPYLDLVYQRSLGETAALVRASGENPERTTLRAGLRLRF